MLNEKVNYIIIIYFISFFLLIASSPIFSLFWLLVPTVYFLWSSNYKDILKIWGFTLGIRYFIFMTSLSGTTILIGLKTLKSLLIIC